MYTTCCLMVIYVHPCAKFGMPVSNSKDEHAHTQIHGESLILFLRPGEGHTEVMHFCDTSSPCDILLC